MTACCWQPIGSRVKLFDDVIDVFDDFYDVYDVYVVYDVYDVACLHDHACINFGVRQEFSPVNTLYMTHLK